MLRTWELSYSDRLILIGKNISNKFPKKYSEALAFFVKLGTMLMSKFEFSYTMPLFFFFSYCCIVRGNTYDHNIKPLQTECKRQKKAIRLITFSDFDGHTSPLFSQLKLLKLQDHIKLQTLHAQILYRQISKDFQLFFY